TACLTSGSRRETVRAEGLEKKSRKAQLFWGRGPLDGMGHAKRSRDIQPAAGPVPSWMRRLSSSVLRVQHD
ncbi:hypothetical protein PF010_g25740, partial [Phytophthora fragariae]